MENIIPHLKNHFFVVCEGMLSYHDGHHVRKHRMFLRTLWRCLHEKNVPITVEEIIESMGGTRAENTKQMIRSNIKRGGWKWLEGEEGNVFGVRFVDEYIRRCEIIEKNELVEIMGMGKQIDRINLNE